MCHYNFLLCLCNFYDQFHKTGHLILDSQTMHSASGRASLWYFRDKPYSNLRDKNYISIKADLWSHGLNIPVDLKRRLTEYMYEDKLDGADCQQIFTFQAFPTTVRI